MIVVGAGEERRELDLLQILLESRKTRLEFPRQLGIGLVLEQLVGRLEIAERPLEPVVSIDLVLQSGEALGQLLRAELLVPERGVRGQPFELTQLRALALDVKGTPWRTGCGRGASGAVPCSRSCRRF
jgi:hypothetical protein